MVESAKNHQQNKQKFSVTKMEKKQKKKTPDQVLPSDLFGGFK